MKRREFLTTAAAAAIAPVLPAVAFAEEKPFNPLFIPDPYIIGQGDVYTIVYDGEDEEMKPFRIAYVRDGDSLTIYRDIG